jgi:hypothetical protein
MRNEKQTSPGIAGEFEELNTLLATSSEDEDECAYTIRSEESDDIGVQFIFFAERKTDLDSGCSLQAESGGKSTGVVEQEKNNAWTNAASRSDAEHDIDSIERSV